MRSPGELSQSERENLMPLSGEEMVIAQHLLIDDEGMKQFPYFDCCGKFFRECKCEKQGYLTMGVGRNIEKIGVSESEAIFLEINDIKRTTVELERAFLWFGKLNTPRRIVILSMGFMGVEKLKTFKKMIKCIESGDYASASNEMLSSVWASQVKKRATRLAQIMKTGQF